MTNLLTSGQIAKKLNVDRDKVNYALRKLAIKPIGRAGQFRVFPEAAIKSVQAFLRRGSAKKARLI